MPWVPDIPEGEPLLVVAPNQEFEITISYYEDSSSGDSGSFTMEFPIVVTPLVPNPSTIQITGNGTTTVTISGYYGPMFNDQVKTMLNYDVDSPDNIAQPTYIESDTLNTEPKGTGVWDKISLENTFEVISYTPDLTRTNDVYYNFVTSNGVVSLKFIRIQDINWTPGMESLRAAIQFTNRKK